MKIKFLIVGVIFLMIVVMVSQFVVVYDIIIIGCSVVSLCFVVDVVSEIVCFIKVIDGCVFIFFVYMWMLLSCFVWWMFGVFNVWVVYYEEWLVNVCGVCQCFQVVMWVLLCGGSDYVIILLIGCMLFYVW